MMTTLPLDFNCAAELRPADPDASAHATVSDGPAPQLAAYDILLVNISAGKDSQASLDVVVAQARAAAVLDRVVTVHADLGDAEWDGVPDLAAEHAAHYGLRFELTSRTADDGHTETILARVAARGMWPDAARRWCTSDHKRGPIRTVMTKLVAELRDSGRVSGRPVRVLNIMGLRAEESRARARRVAYAHNPSASNGRRHVDDWYPIHQFTVTDVWDRIAIAGTRPHPAYAAGMSRLSCRFCVLASRADLVCSARLNPKLADQYAAVEAATGHRFRADLSMADIIAEARGAQHPQLSLLELADIA
jgi:3'-phosphoadenosine 5'-phosphosulfate sulfotransferase (PAPS reductase)/FAD synthetase